MAKTDYIKPGDLDFSTQLITFKNSIGAYSAILDVSAEQVAAHAADSDYFAYVLAGNTVLQNGASQWTAWKRITREGGIFPSSGAPVPPSLPAAVTPTAVGIENRFRSLVRQIKVHPAYNIAIGQALGIEGSNPGGPDLTAIAPTLTTIATGDQVQIGWGWQGHGRSLDMIEILVDRGAGFGLLTYDTTPGYADTAPQPATPTKWTYKAIYRKGDQQVGQWSAEVSVVVGG